MGNRQNRQAQATGNRREVLRLIVAIYFMAQATGLVNEAAGPALFSALLPEQIAPHVFSVSVFAAAYFVLIGQHLARASAFLLGFTLVSHLMAGGGHGVFHILVLTGALLLTGGYLDRPQSRATAPGRIRLTRIKAPRAAVPVTPCAAPHKHPFAQSPDELACLFDQIRETS